MKKALMIAFDRSEVARAAGFGRALGMPYDLLAMDGSDTADLGAETLLTASVSDLPPADALAQAIAPVAAEYSHVAAVSSMRSKDVMPRIAGLMDAAMVTDAIAVESPTVFRRPIVAGSLVETVEVLVEPVVIVFRPAGFPFESGSASESRPVSLSFAQGAERVSVSGKSGGRPELTQAGVVVSGGRPLKDSETFERLIGGLADALGGAVGATRAAVDSGIASNELQVGQTGKVVAPNLYIAAGISGSTQHMAGIKDSKTIVAINTDPQAPIFDFADFGLVMDLYDAIPQLMERVAR